MNALSATADRMHCMEVWGGKQAAEKHFEMPGLEVWIWARPISESAEGGGDVHYLSSCASGRITRMVLADVCGYGNVFRDLAAELRQLMIQNVNYIKQSRFVVDMNQRFSGFSDKGAFATALVSTFFSPTRTYSICNAGHPAPLIYRVAADKWTVLKQPTSADQGDQPVDTPLGVVPEAEYQQVSTRLDPGDLVLSFGNALTESRRADGRYITSAGLIEILEELNPAQPQTMISGLLERIRNEHPDNMADEDSTITLCRATGSSVGWKDNLMAPFRLLRPVSDRTHL